MNSKYGLVVGVFRFKEILTFFFQARERADGMELNGRKICVEYSISKRRHSPTSGISMGQRTL